MRQNLVLIPIETNFFVVNRFKKVIIKNKIKLKNYENLPNNVDSYMSRLCLHTTGNMGVHITQLVRNGYGMVAYQPKTPAACVDIPRPNLEPT